MFLLALDELCFSLLSRLTTLNHQTCICQGGRDVFRLFPPHQGLAGSLCSTVTAVPYPEIRHWSTGLMWRNLWIFLSDVFSMYCTYLWLSLWVNSGLGRALALAVELCGCWCFSAAALVCVGEQKISYGYWLLTCLRWTELGRQCSTRWVNSKDDLWEGLKGKPCLRLIHDMIKSLCQREGR